MRTLIFFSLMFSASISIAELKPDGALVPSLCGENYLESMIAGPDYPIEVCLYSAAGNTDGDLYMGIESGEGIKYYLLKEDRTSTTGQLTAQAVVTNLIGNYTFVQSVSETPEMVVTATYEGGAITYLSGPLFSVKLEIVYVTQSL